MKTKIFVAVLLASCLTTSVSFGHSITQSKVDQIRPGYTTGAELVQLFGQPTTWTIDAQKTTSLQWFHSPGPGLQAYLPLIGPFLGAFNTQLQELSVELGPDGRVRRFTVYDSNGRVTKTARAQRTSEGFK